MPLDIPLAAETAGYTVVIDGRTYRPLLVDSQGRLKLAPTAYTTPTHTAVAVATSSTQALAANTARLYALFINDSDTTIYLKLGAAAALNQGIRLNANGGSYEMHPGAQNVYTGAIYAIQGASGTKNLLVLEGT